MLYIIIKIEICRMASSRLFGDHLINGGTNQGARKRIQTYLN